MELKQGMRTVVLGASGSGKSTLARLMLLKYLAESARDGYYVIDIYPTHYVGNDHLPGLAKYGFVRVNINPDTLDRLGEGEYEDKLNAFDWNGLIRDPSRKERKLGKAVFVIELPPDLRVQAANHLARAIRQAGNSVVLIDEVGAFISNVERKIGDIAMLLTSGRPNGVDTIVVSQHANFTHPLLRSAATHVATFRCSIENELNMLGQIFAGQEKIKNLDYTKREFLIANLQRGDIRTYNLTDTLRAFSATLGRG